ncbi:MAG: TRAP transporter small permease subunit [Burkholderiales bacterium]|nr:TRAP transporter small permease subunit [Burkholderiales bacterium]
MNRLLRAADRISTWVGQTAGWLIVVLVAITAFEVVSRYAFNKPNGWVLDATIMSYGAMVILGGAYALAQQSHVRGDILYGMLQPRTQAIIDLALYLVFFCPGVVALVWAGAAYAHDSWAAGERSALTANGLPVYPLKSLIPLAGALLMMQGLAEILRCVACIRQGAWAPRVEDVQEVDVDRLRSQALAADANVAPATGGRA